MNITKGKIQKAKKVVIYGVEGIGKSTFASCFPETVFIDTEGSTSELSVSRFERPSSWSMLKAQIDFVISNKPCKTLVIDTVDWAERLCIESICSQHNKTGIEDFGYGNGYTYEAEEFGRFLNKLEDVISAGINVVLTAHAVVRKFELPDEAGAYDRYELKLGKKTTNQIAPMVKEWADMVLFANYETHSVQQDDKGKKFKAQGGQRVMYTSHHPCWDAKNRYGLREKLPFNYAEIAHIIPGSKTVETTSETAAPVVSAPTPTKPFTPPTTKVPPFSYETSDFDEIEENEVPEAPADIYANIPKALADLMRVDSVTPEELQTIVAQRGYYPLKTPISAYKDDFISGCLIGAWELVLNEIKKSREVPFN